MARYLPSLLLALLAFGIDRIHKGLQVSAACLAPGQAACSDHAFMFVPERMGNWSGGEMVPVTPFLDYVLVWNTGISYGLLASLPVWALGIVIVGALIGLGIWWWRADHPVVRAGLGIAIGGAASNALDRWLYGAVADFFHFHVGEWSFYIFNLADVAITVGVILLIFDFVGFGRRKT